MKIRAESEGDIRVVVKYNLHAQSGKKKKNDKKKTSQGTQCLTWNHRNIQLLSTNNQKHRAVFYRVQVWKG